MLVLRWNRLCYDIPQLPPTAWSSKNDGATEGRKINKQKEITGEVKEREHRGVEDWGVEWVERGPCLL